MTSLLFGAKKDDFDLLMDLRGSHIPEVWECYPGAFQTVYQGHGCYLYTVDEEGFLRGKTGWNAELVCGHAVPVLSEAPVPDLYARLLDEEAAGNLTVHRYRRDPDYRRRIASEIVDRLVRFGFLDQEDVEPRLERHYGRLIAALRDAMDGHLLE